MAAQAFTFAVAFGRAPPEVVTLGHLATVADLKAELELLFDVAAAHQKLAGLPPRTDDATPLAALTLKQPHKLMLVGTPSAALAAARAAAEAGAAEAVGVDNDLEPPADEGDDDGDAPAISAEEVARAQARIAQRVAAYRPKMLAGFRGGKNVLVLDIDYTLMDHRTPAERPDAMARPFLHAFLEAAYARYDIVIWSATSMRWIVTKMAALGVTTSPRFAVAALYDAGAMIEVRHPRYGPGPVRIKPLPVLWAQHPGAAGPGNTIMLDDLRRNFLANPAHGLRITACRDMPRIRDSDRELAHLAVYLDAIAGAGAGGAAAPGGFAALDHRSWRAVLAARGYADAEADAEARRRAAGRGGGGDA